LVEQFLTENVKVQGTDVEVFQSQLYIGNNSLFHTSWWLVYGV